jgi:hypothetical protein
VRFATRYQVLDEAVRTLRVHTESFEEMRLRESGSTSTRSMQAMVVANRRLNHGADVQLNGSQPMTQSLIQCQPHIRRLRQSEVHRPPLDMRP